VAVRFVDLQFSSGVKTSVDAKGWTTATAQLRFKAFTDTPEDNEGIVRGDARVPYEKSRHPYFRQLRCTGIDISRQGPLHFDVSADYASMPYKEGDENDVAQSPLTQPTIISYFTITSEEPIEDDIEGNAIATVNGEPIEGITRPISDLGVRLQKNFGTFDPASFYLYIDSVNSDTFLGFPPGTLRIANISADEQFYTDQDDNEVPFWSVSVEIHARKPYQCETSEAWYKRVRHEGYWVLNTDPFGGSSLIGPARAVDQQGNPSPKPVLLADNGTALPIPEGSLSIEAKYLLFPVFEDISFSSLGF
jgi:hypothetical protein